MKAGMLPSSGRVLRMLWIASTIVMELLRLCVKNGFSNLTKEQKGRDQPRKDVVNRRQVRALREGCHERKEAQVGVSSREKNTNRKLVRATTKSKSETQTVSNGCVGQGGRDGGFEEHPNIRDLIE